MKSVKQINEGAPGVVIGTYSGKSCDADVLNNNTMYLSRELFKKLIASEEYETAIKLGWYIGYLGHPKDPNCMDFRNACIVMREMHMDDNGDVFATFDLLDTPVGKVVKTFIDAGVQFGISIRGAGDVSSDGTVDPDSFVFRGYDLVTFPAYNDAIPEYTDVAAATDLKAQQNYKKISSAITNNLSSITSCEAIEVLQQHLNPVSEEYTALADREAELAEQSSDTDKDEYIAILEQKLDAMTQLYLNEYHQNSALESRIDEATCDLMDARYGVIASSNISRKKLKSVERILSDQVSRITAALDTEKKKTAALRRTNARLKTAITAADAVKSRVEDECAELQAKNKEISASLKEARDSLNKNNLIYRRKIEANTEALQSNESTISELEEKLSKTVAEKSTLTKKLSNRDKEVEELQSAVTASTNMILQYQQSYADMCADIIGIHVDEIDITASTSPQQLKKMIFGASGSSNSINQAQPESIEFESIYPCDDDIVTI